MDKKIYKTGYMSEIDKFITNFEDNRQDDLCDSRKAEINKHQKIFEKRDNPISENENIFDDL